MNEIATFELNFILAYILGSKKSLVKLRNFFDLTNKDFTNLVKEKTLFTPSELRKLFKTTNSNQPVLSACYHRITTITLEQYKLLGTPTPEKLKGRSKSKLLTLVKQQNPVAELLQSKDVIVLRGVVNNITGWRYFAVISNNNKFNGSVIVGLHDEETK